ncbi:MAG: hypothetical protein ACR2PL_18100, partial [Dehalococcoidia bacterium]
MNEFKAQGSTGPASRSYRIALSDFRLRTLNRYQLTYRLTPSHELSRIFGYLPGNEAGEMHLPQIAVDLLNHLDDRYIRLAEAPALVAVAAIVDAAAAIGFATTALFIFCHWHATALTKRPFGP